MVSCSFLCAIPAEEFFPWGGLTQPWHTLCLYLVISLWGGAWKITLEELARMMCNALRHFNHSLLLLRSALIAALLSAPSRLVKLCWHFTSFLVLGEEKKNPITSNVFFFCHRQTPCFLIRYCVFHSRAISCNPHQRFSLCPLASFKIAELL